MARSRVVDIANFSQFTAINILSDPGHIGGKQPVPNVAIIRLNWTLEDGKPAHCILHGRYSGSFAGSVAQSNALFSALFNTAAYTAIRSAMAASTVTAGVSVRDINTVDNPYIDSNAATLPGTAAGEALPNEVAAVISLKTAKVGPANRGRMYIPGYAVGTTAPGNVIAAAAVADLNTWAATIQGALSASGYVWVISQPERAAYTGSTGTAHPHRDATSTAITSAVMRDNHWDSQRRRGLK